MKFNVINFLKFKIYYPIIDTYDMYYERINRSISYARFGWKHYDFDSTYVYDLMEFKLKRIYNCLKNGDSFQKKEDMDALEEAIKICKRLHDDKYVNKYIKVHNKKWGNIKQKTISTVLNGKPVTRVEFYRPKAKTNNQKKLEYKEITEYYEKAEKDRLLDHDRLCEIFKNYSYRWWD